MWWRLLVKCGFWAFGLRYGVRWSVLCWVSCPTLIHLFIMLCLCLCFFLRCNKCFAENWLVWSPFCCSLRAGCNNLFCAIAMKLLQKQRKRLNIRFCFDSKGNFVSILADSPAWYTICSATGKHLTWKKCWDVCAKLCALPLHDLLSTELLLKQMYAWRLHVNSNVNRLYVCFFNYCI